MAPPEQEREMRELNDTELSEVSGGMSCMESSFTAEVLAGMARVAAIMGNNDTASWLRGMSNGARTAGGPGGRC
jgi:bacteriocin-like protein